jgi:Protein of unknown function (DUF1566)
MKRLLSYAACIIALGTGSISSTALAQTTAPGPYYATPSWDQQLPASTRFIVLSNWGNAAVLDRETGLVWEKAPTPSFSFTWVGASFHCVDLNLGGRTGWRLPALPELMSLVDRSRSDPSLPSGHPFTVPGFEDFWSATTTPSDTARAWHVDSGRVFSRDKTGESGVWCVRGGPGGDTQ